MTRTVQFILSNQATRAPELVNAVAAEMTALMAQAETIDKPEVALNALLGAYINYSIKRGYSKAAMTMLVAAGQAVTIAEAVREGDTPETAVAAANRAPAEPAPSAAAEMANASHDLLKRIETVLVGSEHSVAMVALIGTLQLAAERHPCCTEWIGKECVTLGNNLQKRAAEGHRPAGAPVH